MVVTRSTAAEIGDGITDQKIAAAYAADDYQDMIATARAAGNHAQARRLQELASFTGDRKDSPSRQILASRTSKKNWFASTPSLASDTTVKGNGGHEDGQLESTQSKKSHQPWQDEHDDSSSIVTSCGCRPSKLQPAAPIDASSTTSTPAARQGPKPCACGPHSGHPPIPAPRTPLSPPLDRAPGYRQSDYNGEDGHWATARADA
ncbi:Hypothetical predicted protein [Lecanosticta acicola]|uniref:Uncharacterized protein n=1 Tax=Lecanosticta acicola TaxID=111012 RepID=A0AAI8Z3G7_9PEZI|nr:Hypothetical predicted protein [Lecanosticta acicola]